MEAHPRSSGPRSACYPEVGTLVADTYRVEKVLGNGGMGVVVAARHEVLDQLVAIKFLQGKLAEDHAAVERFRREARVAAKVRSDFVPHVFDVGRLSSGERFLVMEYLDGHDVGEELERRGRFSVHDACMFALQALDAIGRAHAAGIVHRDLKPANLFLAKQRDGSLEVRVLDFGISKQLHQSDLLRLTTESELMGSPLYMPPEQVVTPEQVDARADIWSMGVVLYEMLAGCLPYEAETLPEICTKLMQEDPTPLSRVAPDLPGDLCDLIMRCLVRDPERRLPNARALALGLLPYAPEGAGRLSFVGEPSESFSDRPLHPSLDLRESRVTALGWSQSTNARSGSGLFPSASERTVPPAYERDDSARPAEGRPVRRRARLWLALGAGVGMALLVGLSPRLVGRLPSQAGQVAEPGQMPLARTLTIAHRPHVSSAFAEADRPLDGTAGSHGPVTPQLTRRPASSRGPRAVSLVGQQSPPPDLGGASAGDTSDISAPNQLGQAPPFGIYSDFGGRK